MKTTLSIFLSILAFHGLFYEAEHGINVILYAQLQIGLLYWCKPHAFKHSTTQWALGAWLLAGVFVVVHHSLFSIIIYWFAMVVCWGYLVEVSAKFWLFAAIESIFSFFSNWLYGIANTFKQLGKQEDGVSSSWYQLRLLFVPVILIVPFYLIYSQANTTFEVLNSRLAAWFTEHLVFDLEAGRIWHLILGALLASALLVARVGWKKVHQVSHKWSFILHRQRGTKWPSFSFKTTALRSEYKIAWLSLAALNVLLLFINILDLIFVWFTPQERTAYELSQYVHEGTWLLILSIILAMLVVLVFFRANLNFFSAAKPLRILAYAWLAQNAFLAWSVAVRNIHYISAYKLAHGRIVVFFFLGVVLFGLYTMYEKVRGPKTAYYLVQVNGWAVGVALLVASSVNWDNFITSYNLRYDDPDHYYLYYSLTNNLVPVAKYWQEVHDGKRPTPNTKLPAYKLDNHLQAWETADWRGWNWSDYQQDRAIRRYLAKTSSINH